MGRFRVPAWLRRSLEAVVVAAAVAVVSLVGGRLSTAAPVALPAGAAGALLLAPSVLALAVLPIAWPAAMAATRSDALLGAVTAFLIAADVSVMLANGALQLGGVQRDLPAGFLAVLLAAAPAMAGLAASQLSGPLGFGRRAGAWSAVVGALATVAVLTAVAILA